jgi:hypothetical protein
MHAIARPEHAVRGVGLRLALVSGIPPTAPRLKIKSLAKPTLPVSRPRPGPVRLSLFARPGDQAPTEQTDPAPLLGRHQAQSLSSSTGRPSPSARTPHHGRPLDDESNLGWAVTRHPSRILAFTRLVRRAFAVTGVCGPYTAYDSVVIEGSDITGGIRRSHPRLFSRVWL